MTMTRALRKAVTDAINGLDWNLISDFCCDPAEKKVKPTEMKKALKSAIFTAVQDMIDEGINEISITYFTITIKGDESKHVVSILFTPTKSVGLESPDDEPAMKSEIEALEGLMRSAVQNENYELAAELRDRISSLRR
jgi:excinuclease UvrABC helicase subunit UvrB